LDWLQWLPWCAIDSARSMATQWMRPMHITDVRAHRVRVTLTVTVGVCRVRLVSVMGKGVMVSVRDSVK